THTHTHTHTHTPTLTRTHTHTHTHMNPPTTTTPTTKQHRNNTTHDITTYTHTNLQAHGRSNCTQYTILGHYNTQLLGEIHRCLETNVVLLKYMAMFVQMPKWLGKYLSKTTRLSLR